MLLLPIDETDGRILDRFINPAALTVWAASVIESRIWLSKYYLNAFTIRKYFFRYFTNA